MILEGEFWRWAYSDFLSNSQRGVLAEFIVAKALGCADKPRVQWDAFDLETADGVKVEVKSAAYLQSWEQPKPSQIRFDIAPRKGWHSKSNTYSQSALRPSDVYVFCLFESQQKESANPLDVTQWAFFVCSTTWLDGRFGKQKSVSINALEAAGLKRLVYPELLLQVRAVVGSPLK